MRVTIVENTAVTHHGQVGVALHEAGALIDIHRPFLGQPLPETVDALIVFGGEQSAMDDAAHPYLPALAALMARTARAGLPVLGICLGAQVLARGMGATNILGAAPEFGWCDVTRTGADDPLLSSLPDRFPIFQWHSDTFTLPPGCVHLAGSPAAAVQAFRAGPRAWATQFHFEASRAVVADWARRFPQAVDRLDPAFRADMPARALAEGAAADAAGLTLARAFVAQIAG
ncbi:MAG: type 1 glutamine amidotransferase [Paracoccaceae bacterium]|nr:MAG: type 1 glutamine amidotransferase [Paracoccaceae bacterium]